VHDRERWIWWVANFERVAGEKLSADGRFRTVLDLGAGAGGLAALLAERGIQVVAVAREWYDLPYFEAAAVRGVIMLMLDFRQRLPLSRSAVDLIVHEYSMKFLQTAEELELHLFELDRVLRCGGLVVQRGWGLIAATQAALTNSGIDVVAEFLSRAALLKRVMEQLRWQILDFEIHQPTSTLHFISRKQCTQW
jgi:SAM-dependent methyltransferase